MTDKTSKASDLLENLLSGGHITSEQWQTYKQIRSGDLICSDSDGHSSDESEDNTQVDTTSTSSYLPIASTSTNPSVQIEETSESGPTKWDSNLTVRYIDGKISFNELADIMEKTEGDDISRKDSVGTITQTSSESKGKKKKSKINKDLEMTLKSSSGTRPRRRLPRDLQGLVGEANMMLARGNHDEAIKMALEVVRQSPDCAEPFQSLAMIYEEMGDDIKTFQYLLIAAYLCPSDGDGWVKVAEMASDLGFCKLAISCYTKAIKIFPNNIKLHFERCQLYEKVGDMKKALEAYENLMKALQPNDGELALQLAKDIVKIQYNNGNISSAIEVMETALEKHNSFVTSEEVNVYIELLITNEQYIIALLAFKKYCGLKILSSGIEINDLTNDIITKCDLTIHLMYLVLPIDLRSKLIVTLINLRCLLSINDLLQELLIESAEEIGDLYLDIVDAFIKMDLHEKAKLMLQKLVDTETYNEASVWMRFAECLEKTKEIEAAIIAFSTVVRLAPNHFEARLRLSTLLLSVGKEKEALEIASQSESESQIDLDLLEMRCRLLYSQKFWTEFTKSALILLTSDMIYLKHNKEISTMITSTSYRTRMESLRDIHKDLGLSEDSQFHRYIGNSIDPEEWIEIFVKLLNVLLYKVKDYNEAIRIVFSGYTSSVMSTKQDLINYYSLMCCFISKNMLYTYPLIKALIFRNIDNNQIWNIFCPVMSQFYQDLRHNRFCIRLFIKNPDNIALAYFNGHNALMSGSYKHALAEYVAILKQCPKDSLAAFSVSLAFVHLASQKFTSNRHSIVIQMCAFLDLYLQLRGECQESLYNCGRAFHQLGLLNNAVHFYRRALDCDTQINAKNKHIFNLKREIAYNLSLIYRHSGANDMALLILRQHFVV
ncbi:general transcription factor 3C polypeptide 3-like [Oppia nitens]|uniref:general transcription factor 3C polypeptide 3-like n=1 Tax=Oppia nitens TaxID=1686743 RepID=UPI0023DC25CD|nr:general transcription factor 3C polypeptide 3-like [Oppia nitens]